MLSFSHSNEQILDLFSFLFLSASQRTGLTSTSRPAAASVGGRVNYRDFSRGGPNVPRLSSKKVIVAKVEIEESWCGGCQGWNRRKDGPQVSPSGRIADQVLMTGGRDRTCFRVFGRKCWSSRHLLFHFVLTYSNRETRIPCFSESFESLSVRCRTLSGKCAVCRKRRD
jgi:hypothetical protein